MGQTTFSGPIRSGTVRDAGTYLNTGKVILMQYWTYDIPNLLLTAPNGTTTALTVAAGAFNSSLYIPATSVITNIYADVDVVYNQGTSAAATVGYTSGGTEYVTTLDLKTAAGRINPTFTGAQLLAMNSSTTDATASAAAGVGLSRVYLRITSVGTNASTGHGFIYVFYQQTA